MKYEKFLVETFLREWKETLEYISVFKNQIECLCIPSIRPSPNVLGIQSGRVSNRVENHVIKKISLESKVNELENKIAVFKESIRKSNLTDREKIVLRYMQNGISLSVCAKKENIYKTYVYKIKDSLVTKILAKIDTSKL